MANEKMMKEYGLTTKGSKYAKLPKFPKEKAYGLRFSFRIWKWGIEIWEKGWEN